MLLLTLRPRYGVAGTPSCMLGCILLLIFWTPCCFVHNIPTRPHIRVAIYLDTPWPLRMRPLSCQDVATLANLGRSF